MNKMQNNIKLRSKTVKLIARIIKPFVEEGIILVSEEQFVLQNLRHLVIKGELKPTIVPTLIDQKMAAEMLHLSLSNFKKLERENAFPFKRRKIGTCIRYRNVDLIEFLMSDDE